MTTNVMVPQAGRRRSWGRRVVTGAGALAVVGLVVAVGVGGWARLQLGSSLPQLDGERTLAGLGAQIVVERDALGVPTIRGVSRVDVARALGFVHAQERFFQMDLARRRAAGELAALFGATALPLDRAARVHRFRTRAARVVGAASADERALLEAYAAGVNAGLAALDAPPFEYLLLRATPVPWRPEDGVLVVASMFFTLQDANGTGEARAALLHEAFPAPLAEFLNSTASQWDTPLQGEPRMPPVPPSAEVFDLRREPLAKAAGRRTDDPVEVAGESRGSPWAAWASPDPGDEVVWGSNNWAVGAGATADGRAILANDMHLAIGVPNIWYRASLVWRGEAGEHRVTGVTLPGVASVVAGANGSVAWGFTNTTADWTDRVLVEPTPGESGRYLTPAGPRPFDVVRERIEVKGGEAEELEVRETIWGPLAPPDHRGRLFAISWVAHHPEALNLRLTKVEDASTVAEAFDVANLAGIPAQNFVVADRAGRIGWTVGGRIPRRVGYDGRLPVSWADGQRGWDGWYAPDEYPRVVDPPGGRIVTANNRIAGGAALDMMGDGGYDPGARARQILDGLRALDAATVRDMLGVQLDDRALLMERWRELALGALAGPALRGSDARAEFARLLRDSWSGRASVDAVGYRLVREFRLAAGELAFAPFVERLRTLDPEYPRTPGRALEGPVWALLTQRPAHLLDPRFRTWDELLLAAIDRTAATLTQDGRALRDRTWGEANTSLVQHPLARALPWLGWWLNMPRLPLPGDSHMPRVQTPSSGASERFAVSPGHEEDGYFHMPGGQSGHPLSPHYRDGHHAWVTGEPTPFLPGPPVSRLVLRP